MAVALLTLGAVLAEIALFAVALLYLPRLLLRGGSRDGRWAVGGALVVLLAVSLHGREWAGFALAAVEPPPSQSVARNSRYCGDVNVVDPGLDPLNPERSLDVVEIRPWQFQSPFRYIDTTSSCGNSCAAWLDSGLASRVYVGSESVFRVPYTGQFDELVALRRVDVLPAPECRAQLRQRARWGANLSFFPGDGRRADSSPNIEGCVHYQHAVETPNRSGKTVLVWEEPISSPLLLTVVSRVEHPLWFGMTRVEISSSLIEHFSGAVLADSHLVMFRGAAPTLQAFKPWQHTSRGHLLTSYELHEAYRRENCPTD